MLLKQHRTSGVIVLQKGDISEPWVMAVPLRYGTGAIPIPSLCTCHQRDGPSAAMISLMLLLFHTLNYCAGPTCPISPYLALLCFPPCPIAQPRHLVGVTGMETSDSSAARMGEEGDIEKNRSEASLSPSSAL